MVHIMIARLIRVDFHFEFPHLSLMVVRGHGSMAMKDCTSQLTDAAYEAYRLRRALVCSMLTLHCRRRLHEQRLFYRGLCTCNTNRCSADTLTHTCGHGFRTWRREMRWRNCFSAWSASRVIATRKCCDVRTRSVPTAWSDTRRRMTSRDEPCQVYIASMGHVYQNLYTYIAAS